MHSNSSSTSWLARSLPVRSDLHLSRKLWHLLTGLLMITILLSGIKQGPALAILGGLLAWSASFEFIRLRNPAFNEKCVKFFGAVIRSHEVSKVSGMPYYLASSFLAVAIFPKPVAILSLIFLAVGDPIASLFGVLFKGKSIQIFEGKSLHGTAAGFAACAISAWFFLKMNNINGINLVRLSLLGGFAGAIAELLPMELDDNFTIPMVSGFIMWIGFIAVHFV